MFRSPAMLARDEGEATLWFPAARRERRIRSAERLPLTPVTASHDLRAARGSDWTLILFYHHACIFPCAAQTRAALKTLPLALYIRLASSWRKTLGTQALACAYALPANGTKSSSGAIRRRVSE
jgi:hypothetical protein